MSNAGVQQIQIGQKEISYDTLPVFTWGAHCNADSPGKSLRLLNMDGTELNDPSQYGMALNVAEQPHLVIQTENDPSKLYWLGSSGTQLTFVIEYEETQWVSHVPDRKTVYSE